MEQFVSEKSINCYEIGSLYHFYVRTDFPTWRKANLVEINSFSSKLGAAQSLTLLAANELPVDPSTDPAHLSGNFAHFDGVVIAKEDNKNYLYVLFKNGTGYDVDCFRCLSKSILNSEVSFLDEEVTTSGVTASAGKVASSGVTASAGKAASSGVTASVEKATTSGVTASAGKAASSGVTASVGKAVASDVAASIENGEIGNTPNNKSARKSSGVTATSEKE